MGAPLDRPTGWHGRAHQVDPAVIPAVIRVLGLPSHESTLLRDDTPLSGLGVDSLALILIADVLADDGWHVDMVEARSSATIGELSACCAPHSAAS